MRKFRKDDVVVFKQTSGDCEFIAKNGARAVVTGYSSCGRYLEVMWIRDDKSSNQGDGGYYEQDFKLFRAKEVEEYGIAKFIRKINDK